MLTGFHNHSTYSDGENSLEEMIAAADHAGFREFGMSDHLVLPPGPGYDEKSWSMTRESLGDYVHDVLELKKKYDREDFKVRLGVEVDFFEENALETAELLKKYPFDYYIGAAHYCGKFPLDHSPVDWQDLSQEQINQIWRDYWIKMKKMAASGIYDFAAHLDLPKKYMFCPDENQDDLIRDLMQELARQKMPIEINTAGRDKACKVFYPSEEILSSAISLGLPILINMDAHAVPQIQRYFFEAEQWLNKLGGQRIVSICDHRMQLEVGSLK